MTIDIDNNALTQKKPNTDFDWTIYADGTFAGLSILIPIPILDWIFEQIFRRRMLKTIAKRRDHPVDPAIQRLFYQIQSDGWIRGCLLFPFKLTLWLLKRISRKILYFLTVKEASDMVSYYWHRAFLLDYMLSQGHLDQVEQAEVAYIALHTVLDDITVSPLSQLAQQITQGTRKVFRLLRRVRRNEGDAAAETQRAEMTAAWADFSGYFEALAERYDDKFLVVQRDASTTT
ncbi:MAG: hypothetical protein AAF629_29455 [Chloroflexota bacterium]